jgi:hypothetical protein
LVAVVLLLIILQKRYMVATLAAWLASSWTLFFFAYRVNVLHIRKLTILALPVAAHSLGSTILTVGNSVLYFASGILPTAQHARLVFILLFSDPPSDPEPHHSSA